MKVVIGLFSQETNSFSPIVCDMSMFRRVPDYLPLETMKNILTKEGIQIIPSEFLRAKSSSGIVTPDVLETATNEIVAAIKRNRPVDGVLLFMHGATQVVGEDDGTGYLIEKVRKAAGSEATVGVTFDFHANVTKKMIKNADVICGYRTYPHSDIADTVKRMTELSVDMMCGRRQPHMVAVKLPMIHQAEACLTTEGPMSDLMYKAVPKNYPGVYDISVFQVQPWLNMPDLGASVIVIADTRDNAYAAADSIARDYWSIKDKLKYTLNNLDDIIDIVDLKHGCPVIISDSADAPPAGSPGDSVFILNRLLERCLADKYVCYMTLNDRDSVYNAFKTGVGNMAAFTLGASYDTTKQKPVTANAYVKCLYDGKYSVNSSVYGKNYDIGPSALIQIGKISVLLSQGQATSVFPEIYTSAGLCIEDADIIIVKSATQYRSYYAKYSHLMFTVDTPGCSSSNLFTYNYDRISHPLYPFDEIKQYSPLFRTAGYKK